MTTPYQKPIPTTEEQYKVKKALQILSSSHNLKAVSVFITTLCLENISLTKEVNDHRRQLGFEEIKINDPVEVVKAFLGQRF